MSVKVIVHDRNNISVVSKPQNVSIVKDDSRTVNIDRGPKGPKGDVGPIGPSGPPAYFYATDIGNGEDTEFIIAHDLDTKDLAVAIYRNAEPWDEVVVDNERTTENEITLKFEEAPALNEYRVIIK